MMLSCQLGRVCLSVDVDSNSIRRNVFIYLVPVVVKFYCTKCDNKIYFINLNEMSIKWRTKNNKLTL